MIELRLRTRDDRYGVYVPSWEVTTLLSLCVKAANKETGGVLVGVYSERLDCAIVRFATGPGPDSRAGRTWFERGVRGLQEALGRRWLEKREYYVGEWHYHPSAPPDPSSDDFRQMIAISRMDSYKCPEPILLILGGNPEGAWSVSGHVFPRGEPPMLMTKAHAG